MKKPIKNGQTTTSVLQKHSDSRRQFLKMGGLAVAGSSLLLYGCSNDDDNMEPMEVFDLGSGDVGILNYAYALEQLEAAFYTQVLAGSYWAGANAEEKLILEDLYKHEVIHREFFKAAIGANAPANQVLPTLEFDFSSVNFGNRASVLGTAKVLEDTGVAAYNGAGSLLQNPTFLVLAGKIVSVEARHAAAIRSIFDSNPTSFAGDDIIDGDGLDLAKSPQMILQAVGETGFVKTPFTANNLPSGS